MANSDNDNEKSVSSGGFDHASHTIDASGLLCPEPLVLCKQALDTLAPQALVHVIATDPHAEIDFEVFTRRTRHSLVRSAWVEDSYHVLIRKD